MKIWESFKDSMNNNNEMFSLEFPIINLRIITETVFCVLVCTFLNPSTDSEIFFVLCIYITETKENGL